MKQTQDEHLNGSKKQRITFLQIKHRNGTMESRKQ